VAPPPVGETKQARGTVLAVFRKLPDGSWKIFRSMGSIEPGGSHELVYEKQHKKLLQASAEWLRSGTYEQ
jgi:hypothetical protein